jgi:hypothetical protein
MTISNVLESFPVNLQEPVQRLYWLLINEMGVPREDFSELRKTVQHLAQSQHELAEAQKRTESRVEELAEAQKRTESRVGELAVAQKRTESCVEELADAQKRTEEKLQLLTDELRAGFRMVNEQFAALGSRWGLQTESALRKAVEAILQDTGHTVTRGYYGQREVDLVVRNGTHILLEIMSRLKNDDVDKLLESAADYEQREGIRPNLIIAAAYIGPGPMRRLLDSKLPIRFYSGEDDEVVA